MKILRDAQVEELKFVLQESRHLLDASQHALEQKDELLHSAVQRIGELQDALLTEKRCHAAVAAAASQALSEGVDLRAELDEIALALQADVARLEEWFVSDEK